MFIIKWWRYCRGYLVISLKGRGIERFLNLAIARGICFWDLNKQKTEARLCINLNSFKNLRPLLRQTRCRLSILKKVGLPFWKWRLRRRWGLVVGALIFVAGLYCATAVVWQVRVIGTEHLDEAEVIELARQMGLRPWVWKRSLDLTELEEELARRHPGITWAGIRLRGTLVEIEIVEHLQEPIIDRSPADLVAAKDGLVIRVLVLDGEAVVDPGDTVVKGDLLIRGSLVIPDPSLPPGSVAVRARGEVEARVWYEAVEPLNQIVPEQIDTGNIRQSFSIFWSDKSLRLHGPAQSPFNKYRQEIVKWRWRWRNIALPVELVKATYYEIKIVEKAVSRTEAQRLARAKALAELKRQLPDEVTVERLYFLDFAERSQEWIRAVAETREDIAEIRLHNP